MKTWYRSTTDSKLTGLCGGISEATGVDASVVRVTAAAAALFSGGTAIPLYIIASILVPKRPSFHTDRPAGSAWFEPHAAHGAAMAANPEPWSRPLMNDHEQHAIRREIAELRAKLAKFDDEQKPRA